MFSKELERARERVFRLLSYRSRTEAEISARLRQYGFSPEVIAALTSYLKDCHLIDDRAFAAEWIRYRLRERKRGKRYLYKELVHKGVSCEIATEAVEFISEEEEYNMVFEQAYKKLKKGYSWSTIGRYLARQGFPSWMIYRVRRNMITEPVDD